MKMENENLKCYACGADCSSQGFVVQYGDYGATIGLCRGCVNKGITLRTPSGVKFEEKTLPEECYIEATRNISKHLNVVLTTEDLKEFYKSYWLLTKYSIYVYSYRNRLLKEKYGEV